MQVATSSLIAGWLKVPGRTLLPGHGRLSGLFHQAAETHLGGPQEFRIAALHEGSQEHIQRTIRPRAG